MSNPTVGLLLDNLSDNTGDKAIRLVMERFFREHSIDYEVVHPLEFDPFDYGTLIIGGGNLIRNPGDDFYDAFRVKGPHVLNVAGVIADRELEYLGDYRYVSVRSTADSIQLAASGVDSMVAPCVTVSMRTSIRAPTALTGRLAVQLAHPVLRACPEIEETLAAVNVPKVFVPFTHYNFDRETMMPLASRLDSPLLDCWEPYELQALIGASACLITTSLHAAIFAYTANVPFIAWSGVETIKRFCRDRGLESLLFGTTEELKKAIEVMLANPPDFSVQLARDNESIREHFARLTDVLPRHSYPSLTEEGGTRVSRLQQRMQERDFSSARRMRSVEQRLRTQHAQLVKALAAKEAADQALIDYQRVAEQALANAAAKLAFAPSPDGFEILQGIRRVALRIAPAGTARGRVVATCVRGGAYFFKHGLRSFLLRLLKPWKWWNTSLPDE